MTDERQMTEKDATATDVAGLVEELVERKKLKYIGDCKCGCCQLVPLNLIVRTLSVLDAQRQENERRDTLLIDWRDAREAIFAVETPTPEMFTRLGSAELALMAHARALTPSQEAEHG